MLGFSSASLPLLSELQAGPIAFAGRPFRAGTACKALPGPLARHEGLGRHSSVAQWALSCGAWHGPVPGWAGQPICSDILGLGTGSGDGVLTLRQPGDQVVTKEDYVAGCGLAGVWIASLVSVRLDSQITRGGRPKE